MANFLYQSTKSSQPATSQYGNVAVQHLINMFLEEQVQLLFTLQMVLGFTFGKITRTRFIFLMCEMGRNDLADFQLNRLFALWTKE